MLGPIKIVKQGCEALLVFPHSNQSQSKYLLRVRFCSFVVVTPRILEAPLFAPGQIPRKFQNTRRGLFIPRLKLWKLWNCGGGPF